MKIHLAIGADHRGFSHKTFLQQVTELDGYILEWHDVGAYSPERSDYPQFAYAAVDILKEQRVELAILICGTGVGMAVAANRVPGVFAGVAWCAEVARRAREEDNVNVLVLPADYISPEQGTEIVAAWLAATFRGGRYAERIAQIRQ